MMPYLLATENSCYKMCLSNKGTTIKVKNRLERSGKNTLEEGFNPCPFKPLTPNSDQHHVSPSSIHGYVASHADVLRGPSRVPAPRSFVSTSVWEVNPYVARTNGYQS